MSAKAMLLHKSKLILNSGLVREVVIWNVSKSKEYPQGIKYRMVLVEPVWKKILILFDNHAPKGPHRHDVNGKEYLYNFVSMSQLVEDFLRLEVILENEYENNEN